jgi:uncharacterized membrane protein (UPF0127 family)
MASNISNTMENTPGSKPETEKPKSNFYLLSLLFVCLIILSFSSLSYYQGKKHMSEQVAADADPVLEKETTVTSSYKTKTIRMGGEVFIADIADTNESRQTGLSGRTSLRENQAMMFIFPTDGQNLFWMKDMNFSIDMIWLDAEKKIVYIARDAAPESFPQTFGPTTLTRYVVEVQAGISEKLGLKVGDSVIF